MISPVKIGFIASLSLHSLLAVVILINQENSIKISKKNNNTIAISLENINKEVNDQSINQQKKYQKPKKQNMQKSKPQKVTKQEIITPQEIQEEQQVEKIEEIDKKIDEEKVNEAQDTQDAVASSGMTQEIDTNSELYAEILRIINKYNSYPRDAYRRGITGSVEVRFVLTKNGEIQDVEILNKIHNSLGEGAIKAINNAYKQFPSVDNNLRIKVKLTYNLT